MSDIDASSLLASAGGARPAGDVEALITTLRKGYPCVRAADVIREQAQEIARLTARRDTDTDLIAAQFVQCKRLEAERDAALALLKQVNNWKALHASIRELEDELFPEDAAQRKESKL